MQTIALICALILAAVIAFVERYTRREAEQDVRFLRQQRDQERDAWRGRAVLAEDNLEIAAHNERESMRVMENARRTIEMQLENAKTRDQQIQRLEKTVLALDLQRSNAEAERRSRALLAAVVMPDGEIQGGAGLEPGMRLYRLVQPEVADQLNLQLQQQLEQAASTMEVARAEIKSLRARLDIGSAVDRFLGWRLPDNFQPDCYIGFDSISASRSRGWPTGTNLFTADQATGMFEYCFGITPAQPNKLCDDPTARMQG